jgi:hypothetical protein
MTTMARLFAPFRDELGDSAFEDLVRIYPEGLQRPHSFWCILPIDDSRTKSVLERLRQAGYTPWQDRSRPRDKAREFTLHLERRYDVAHLSFYPYLELSPRTEGSWGPYRDEATGFVKLDVHQLDNSADFAAAYTSRYVVADRVKRLIELAGLSHVLFRPALLSDPEESGDEEGVSKILRWEDWGPPWWEITSDHTLPPVSSSMDLTDCKNTPVPPGDPTISYTRREGLYLWPELHYRAGDMAPAATFDLARTLEHFGGELRWDDRPLVASQRFYHFCIDHGLKAEWVPVQIDP